MMSEDIKDVIKVIAFITVILGGLVLLGSCDSGWSVAGWEV